MLIYLFMELRISLYLNGVASDNSEKSVINIQYSPLKHTDFLCDYGFI